MDTSETYIKMCDCEEIQAQSPHVSFNYFAGPKSHTVYYGGIDTIETNYIWLPRQDQLQEMCKHADDIYALTRLFSRAINDGRIFLVGDTGKCFTSMEQLWLAFVMQQKFGKTWDGDKWVKQ